ncbi:MAG: hypothetical protein KA981_00300 [Bacteroidia bacterium]|jgi:hypothetical protein|nr:hypothetical protein [Bacteroidia bacterium]
MKRENLTGIRHMLFLAFFGLISVVGSAQSVSYTVTEDNPEAKNLFISLNVIDGTVYNPNTGLAFNIYANYFLGKTFQVDIDFKRAYTDDNADAVFAPKGLKKYNHFRVGGEFNFSTRTRVRSTRVVLSSQKGGNYTYTRYINVPANRKSIWALRGGLQTFYQNCQVDNDPFKTYGGNDIRYKDSKGDLQYIDDNNNFETVNYTMRSSGLYAGLDYKNLVNIRIKPEGYHDKGTTTRNNFYLDALLTPVVKYELKPNEKQGQYAGVDINISENERSVLGWRFGWQYDTGKWAGFSMKAEVGQQPGRPDDKWFLSAGIGLHIGGKIKL